MCRNKSRKKVVVCCNMFKTVQWVVQSPAIDENNGFRLCKSTKITLITHHMKRRQSRF